MAGESPRAGAAPAALDAFAGAAERLAAAPTLDAALGALASALAGATAAETVIVRLADASTGRFVTRGLAASSAALAARLEGSAVEPFEVSGELTSLDALPEDLRKLIGRTGADVVLVVPVLASGVLAGTLELVRSGEPFGAGDRLLARVAASQAALLAGGSANGAPAGDEPDVLDALGDALAAAAEGPRLPRVLTRLAAQATGARAAVFWEPAAEGEGHVASASHGVVADLDLEAVEPGVPAAGDRSVVAVERNDDLPAGARTVVTLRLGEPRALLQLFAGSEPAPEVLAALARFAGRAGQALRASAKAGHAAAELQHTRALLGVVGQAIAELSLSHTLETAVARVGELLETDRVVVYLGGEGPLTPVAGRGLASGDEEVASALLRLALGPYRARGAVVVEDASRDPGFASVREAVAEAGVEAAVAVPLIVPDDAIGLLVAYLPRGRTPTPDETALLAALAAQLGVAVQNARLHEEAKRLGSERARALESERQASRQLRAFYEVSQSFTSSLSLEETLDAVARTAVELIGADAAVIRTHDRRRNTLVPRAIHVADERLRPALETTLARPHRLDTEPARQLVEARRPVLLTASLAEGLGGTYELFAPFLERGASAAVVPIATAGELVAVLTVVSLDAERPIGQTALDATASLAAHAVLAVENARLYQQQRHFLEAMQHALLPRSLPEVPGLELGHAYESSARLEVGGDVYDFLPLEDGRLAIVLGDVTGHGVDAAADMAMAKFVFRTLAREHDRPGELLTAANEVVVGDIAVGKFITMACAVVDPRSGEVRCASAGHPAPRVVRAAGVEELGAGGVALGIDPGQHYAEETTTLEPGDAVVLYTDGVIEARCDGELFGVERLDEVLRQHAALPAADLAAEVLAETRAFGGGELVDDCAVVVVKRPADATSE